jgi:hypothetical protein
MKKIYTLLLLAFVSLETMAQSFYEPCNYAANSDLVGKVNASTDSAWLQVAATASGSLAGNVTIADTGLVFPGYNYSGKNALFSQFPVSGGAGQSAGIRFPTNAPYYLTGSTPGTVYVSFLVNLSRTTSTTVPFMSLNLGTTTYRARILARRGSPATSFRFGIGHQSTATSNTFTGPTTDSTFPQNEVHLLVVKYIKTATGLSDTMKLYVFRASDGILPAAEPATAHAVYFETGSFIKPDINGIGLYQPSGGNGSGDNTRIFIDDIRVSNTWSTSVTLPVALLSFSAGKTTAGVQLRWTTAHERNNAYFAVLRSANGRDFEQVARIAGTGTTGAEQQYVYTDKVPLKGTAYYRLKQVDKDGKEKLYQVVTVQQGADRNRISVIAGESRSLIVNMHTGKAQATTVRIHSMMGQLLTMQQVTLLPGDNSLRLAVPQMPAGTYIASMTTDEGTVSSKFIYP